MNEFTPRLIGYHVNDEVRCRQFLNNQINAIISEGNEDWLGTGMYFWDNKGNAEYWLSEKKRKNNENQKFICIESCLNLECVFDFTDKNVISGFSKIWKQFLLQQKEAGKDTSKLENASIGKQLDVLFAFFDGLKDNYDIIKGCGYYPAYTQFSNMFKFTYSYGESTAKREGPHLTQKAKIIYCVRNHVKILNRQESAI